MSDVGASYCRTEAISDAYLGQSMTATLPAPRYRGGRNLPYTNYYTLYFSSMVMGRPGKEGPWGREGRMQEIEPNFTPCNAAQFVSPPCNAAQSTSTTTVYKPVPAKPGHTTLRQSSNSCDDNRERGSGPGHCELPHQCSADPQTDVRMS